jgi:signal transduction histidine kinase
VPEPAETDPSHASPLAATPHVAEVQRWLPRPSPGARAMTGPGDGTDPARDAGRILVVADNADLRAYLGRLLGERWPVEIFADEGTAREAARAQPPALVIVDAAMPGREGVQVVRALRADPAIASVPVIVLSSWAGEEAAVAGLEAGADDVLGKPFAAQELLARVQAHADLARLRREVRQLREEQIAALAHDLRTPLTSIQVGLGLLAAGNGARLTEDGREVLGTVGRNVQRLVVHVNDLVTINQLNAGVLQVQREPLDLRAVVEESLGAVRALFRDRNQVVEVDMPVPLPIRGDARRLEQVLTNMLVNAHRHTPTGTRVTITGRAEAREVTLAVCDTGPGIPVSELEHVFQPYRQASGDKGGSGLGLTIVRRLLALQDGKIWAESTPDRGACFRIALPHAPQGATREER